MLAVFAIVYMPNQATHSGDASLVIFSSDHPRYLTVANIGYDWVYVTWNSLPLTCGGSQWVYKIMYSNISASFSNIIPDMYTAHNITSLLSNAKYSFTVVAYSAADERGASSFSHPPLFLVPGT